jgi:hypothetical protein
MERKKKTMLDFNKIRSDMRLIKKQKKELIRQTLLLKEALQDAIERIPDYMLDPFVCEMLGHPQPKELGNGMCYCKRVTCIASGQVIKFSGIAESCAYSLDQKHCWHRMMSNVVIPGKSVLDEVCCFCGMTKQTEVQLPASYSYSYDASKHGRYAPVYQVLY